MYCNNRDSRGLLQKRIIEKHGFTVVAETEDVQATVERHSELHLDIIAVNASPSILNGYIMQRAFESSHSSSNTIIINFVVSL